VDWPSCPPANEEARILTDMRSPVSRRVLGECNAITSRELGHRELTFASNLETEFGPNDIVR